MLDELRVGPQGGQKLAAILDGGAFLVSTLDSVLPQTARLIRNSKVVLSTVHDVSPGLEATATDLDSILGGVERMDGGYRTLVDTAPTAFSGIDALIADNSPTMVQLLGNLTTVAQQSYIRVPALQELFFPQYRAGSALEAVASTFRDGGVWGAVNLYPRHSCDFNLPKSPPTVGDFPEPYLLHLLPQPRSQVPGAGRAQRADAARRRHGRSAAGCEPAAAGGSDPDRSAHDSDTLCGPGPSVAAATARTLTRSPSRGPHR